jgi:hypothetical protein
VRIQLIREKLGDRRQCERFFLPFFEARKISYDEGYTITNEEFSELITYHEALILESVGIETIDTNFEPAMRDDKGWKDLINKEIVSHEGSPEKGLLDLISFIIDEKKYLRYC